MTKQDESFDSAVETICKVYGIDKGELQRRLECFWKVDDWPDDEKNVLLEALLGQARTILVEVDRGGKLWHWGGSRRPLRFGDVGSRKAVLQPIPYDDTLDGMSSGGSLKEEFQVLRDRVEALEAKHGRQLHGTRTAEKGRRDSVTREEEA